MQLKQRIWILPIFSLVIIIVFMLGMGVVYFFNQSTLEKLDNINSVYVPVKNRLADIHNHVLHVQTIFERVVTTQDIDLMEETQGHADVIKAGLAFVTQSLPDLPGAKEMPAMFNKYYASAISLAEKLINTNMTEMNREIEQVNFFRNHFDEHLQDLEDFLVTQYKENATKAQQQMQQLTWILFSMILILSTILTVGSFVIMRNLSQRLSVLTNFAQQVQGGNYDNQVDVKWNDEFSIVVSAFNSMVESVKSSTDKLNRLANYDNLTEVYNRNGLLEKIEAEIRSVKRHKYPMSFVMCDVDKFKTVNDTYGHEVGDMILQEFAKCLRKGLRMEDTIGRYGGDEFSVILPHTNADAAKIALERVRKCFSGQVFKDHNGNEFSTTCSFGITSFHPDMDQTIMMRTADEALYMSKQNGRNCVSIKEWEPQVDNDSQ